VDQPDHVLRNRLLWDTQAPDWVACGRRGWAEHELTWGVWHIPEAHVRALPPVRDRDVVELGCGTAYFSARLARRGARPVGVDPTPAQLQTARRMQEETGIRFPLVEAPAERVPLADSSFDLAFSEYGASLWADPNLWIPEAARLLRPRGRLVFLTNSVLAYLCFPDEPGHADEQLHRPQAGMYVTKWPGEEGTEYHLAHSDWIKLLHANGFELEDLVEVYAPTDAEDHGYYETVTAEWAQKWPCEDLWVARKGG
jgi:SAM-dependent methyltransferase